MNSSGFKGLDDRKIVTWENLEQELNSVRKDISTIKDMEVSEEAKVLILEELRKQAHEVKEKMHDYIDSL